MSMTVGFNPQHSAAQRNYGVINLAKQQNQISFKGSKPVTATIRQLLDKLENPGSYRCLSILDNSSGTNFDYAAKIGKVKNPLVKYFVHSPSEELAVTLGEDGKVIDIFESKKHPQNKVQEVVEKSLAELLGQFSNPKVTPVTIQGPINEIHLMKKQA